MAPAPANYDEALVPAYALPDLLAGVDAAGWLARREVLLETFRAEVYGRSPQSGWELRAQRERAQEGIWNGLADRSEIVATLRGPCGERSFRILLHLPHAVSGPLPLQLGLNFAGNHTVVTDPWPTLTTAWLPAREHEGFAGGAAREADRGASARRWPIPWLVAEGYAVATVYYGEIESDRHGAWRDGLRGAFSSSDPSATDDGWGAIGAWAFGLSRALDALLACEPRLDRARLGLTGHSRLGKSALWAAAQDTRFAWVMSNESGCTGAALARRRYGERQVHLNTTFPHWCCRAYHRYDEREHELPVDQHQLLALIAPRIVHVASAEGDRWADPRGEFLACVHASPAWELLGGSGIAAGCAMPPLNQMVGALVRYHIRPGPHDMTELDWWHLVQGLAGGSKAPGCRNR